MAQLLPDPAPHLRGRDRRALVRDDKGRDRLAVALVGQADDADLGHARVAEEAVFHFERVYVLAALDDEVLDPAGDFDVAVRVHFRFVAGLDALR